MPTPGNRPSPVQSCLGPCHLVVSLSHSELIFKAGQRDQQYQQHKNHYNYILNAYRNYIPWLFIISFQVSNICTSIYKYNAVPEWYNCKIINKYQIHVVTVGLFVGTRVALCSGEGLALSRRHSISWAKGDLSLTQYLSGGTWRHWQLVLSLSVFTHTCLHIHPWENWINNRYITGIAQFVLHRDNVYQPYFTWHTRFSRSDYWTHWTLGIFKCNLPVINFQANFDFW